MWAIIKELFEPVTSGVARNKLCVAGYSKRQSALMTSLLL
jgi:hypothetical protein